MSRISRWTHRSGNRYVSGRPRRLLKRSKIGRLTDVRPGRACHDPIVLILIRLDALDPPSGRVGLAGGPEVAFVGWLGLLRVLSELLASPTR
jgi:hypothetical protein